jgi:hypothetical protein
VAAVAALTGRVLTQDDAAVAAGTLLTVGGGRLADLPPGAASRADYLQQIPTTEDTQLAGTSPQGIVYEGKPRVITRCTRSRMSVILAMSRATSPAVNDEGAGARILRVVAQVADSVEGSEDLAYGWI